MQKLCHRDLVPVRNCNTCTKTVKGAYVFNNVPFVFVVNDIFC